MSVVNPDVIPAALWGDPEIHRRVQKIFNQARVSERAKQAEFDKAIEAIRSDYAERLRAIGIHPDWAEYFVKVGVYNERPLFIRKSGE